jgi:GT2 family glycosyltransferase
MFDVTASIVLYKNDVNKVTKTINSFLDTELNVLLYLIDNSPDDRLKCLAKEKRIIYLFNNKNVGFGVGHNIAIRKCIDKSKYHLVLNPDIYFEKGTLENIFCFMEKNIDVGLLMPKIFYPDGRIQYLCKMLPTPFDIFIRRFLPFRGYVEKRNIKYELRFTGYNKIMNVPYLSGCFMFLRNSVLMKVGLFDERFFMYFEDTDLTRRIHKKYKTVFYPEVYVYHDYGKESYKSFRVLFIHIVNAFIYFNKYGWFFDKERKEVNNTLLKELGYHSVKTIVKL